MAITFSKQPLTFFNVNEPAIFEFSSDADLGVNVNDLVADLKIQSLYTSRMFTVKNILPNYATGIFRLDVSGYLKSLMLDNFNFDFDSSNKQYTIERFSIGVAVHAENGADVFGDEFIFDSGYIFDTTFVFAEQVPNDSNVNTGFYSMLGVNELDQALKTQKDLTKFNILAPKYVEFAEGFTNTLSIFTGVLGAGVTSVGGITSPVPAITGVANGIISDAQIAKMYHPSPITTTLNNTAIPVFGISYKPDECEETIQFRFFTSFAGWCYFYAQKEPITASRGSSQYINNNFFNAQELKNSTLQRSVVNKKELSLNGSKVLELKDTFIELLNSPKVEILLPRGFTSCKLTGSINVKKFNFDFNIVVDLTNLNTTGL